MDKKEKGICLSIRFITTLYIVLKRTLPCGTPAS